MSVRAPLRLYLQGDLIKTHPRKNRGKQTDLGDYEYQWNAVLDSSTGTWRVTANGPTFSAGRLDCTVVSDGELRRDNDVDYVFKDVVKHLHEPKLFGDVGHDLAVNMTLDLEPHFRK